MDRFLEKLQAFQIFKPLKFFENLCQEIQNSKNFHVFYFLSNFMTWSNRFAIAFISKLIMNMRGVLYCKRKNWLSYNFLSEMWRKSICINPYLPFFLNILAQYSNTYNFFHSIIKLSLLPPGGFFTHSFYIQI